MEENNVQPQLVTYLPHVSRLEINVFVAPLAVGELCSSKQFTYKAVNTPEILLLGASATAGIIFDYLCISCTAKNHFIGDEKVD